MSSIIKEWYRFIYFSALLSVSACSAFGGKKLFKYAMTVGLLNLPPWNKSFIYLLHNPVPVTEGHFLYLQVLFFFFFPFDFNKKKRKVYFQRETRQKVLGLQRVTLQAEFSEWGFHSGDPLLAIHDLCRESPLVLWRTKAAEDLWESRVDSRMEIMPSWDVHQHISPVRVEDGCRTTSNQWWTLPSQPTSCRWTGAWQLQEAGAIWFGCLLWLVTAVWFPDPCGFRQLWKVWRSRQRGKSCSHQRWIRRAPEWNRTRCWLTCGVSVVTIQT